MTHLTPTNSAHCAHGKGWTVDCEDCGRRAGGELLSGNAVRQRLEMLEHAVSRLTNAALILDEKAAERDSLPPLGSHWKYDDADGTVIEIEAHQGGVFAPIQAFRTSDVNKSTWSLSLEFFREHFVKVDGSSTIEPLKSINDAAPRVRRLSDKFEPSEGNEKVCGNCAQPLHKHYSGPFSEPDVYHCSKYGVPREPAKRVDISLLRQAAERCRDAKSRDLVEALRHLQACFGWETVLTLLAQLDAAEAELDSIRERSEDNEAE